MSSQQGASRLLGDLRRSPQVLLPYQADAVRELVQEIITLHESKTQLSAVSSANDPNINVQDCFLRRHKRCLVVYHSVRCNRVEALRWTTGAVLLPGAKENLASSEVDYFKAYSKAVSEYLDNCGLDLTTVSFEGKPPNLLPSVFFYLTLTHLTASKESKTSQA